MRCYSVALIVASGGRRQRHGDIIDGMDVVGVIIVVAVVNFFSFLLMDFARRARSNTGVNLSVVGVFLVYLCRLR